MVELRRFAVAFGVFGIRIAPMSTRRRKPIQLTFADRLTKNGTVRSKPGPKAAARAAIRHRARPVHRAYHPLHVTMRAVRGLPSFRQQALFGAFERAFRTTRREDFRIVEYSVQDNHLHLLVEANDNDALARGMKSFSVRANRLFNAAFGRGRGRVWADRYHRRTLTSPRQVRNALVYCLNNYRKHFDVTHGRPSLDPCASGLWFEGWVSTRAHPEATPRPTEPPTTFLLRTGWQRHGLLHPGERPRAMS